MKIGIDIRNIGKKRTGDEVVFFNLTKNLARIDNANEYKLFTDITDENILAKIKKDLAIEGRNNFEIVSLTPSPSPASGRGWLNNKFTWNFWTIGAYLRAQPLDIYLTQYITPWFVPKKIKIATIIHDISFNFYPQFIKWPDLFFLKTLIPLSLRRADKIIGVSLFTCDEIIKFYKINPEKVDWIHNAVSEDFLAQNISEEKISEIRKKYNLPEKFILYIGTLQPRKNLPTLIEAYALLKKEIEPVKLVLAGGKGYNYDKKIDEILERNNFKSDVYLPGYIDEEDKAALIKSSAAFCSPSFYEGFGIPVLEAMSLGVPVACSNIPPHKEIADGAALFFDPEIPGELAQKLRDLLQNEVIKNNLREKGEILARNFSWEKTATKMLEIFKNI